MADQLAAPNPDQNPEVAPAPQVTDQEIVQVLSGYKAEAEHARKSGPNPRDDTWKDNWDLYWGRVDFSDKADWQSKHVMPEAPQFVDRWAAAMREALTQPGRFFNVEDPADTNKDLIPHVERLMDLLLARAGRTPDGHATDFASVFEDQMKLGALMACCATVTWKEGFDGGYVAVESVDPRNVWLDPTGRGMYRLRQVHIDKHELLQMAEQADVEGQPIYNIDRIRDLTASMDEDKRTEREDAAGHGAGGRESARKEITLDEYLCDVLMPDGRVLARNALITVANDKWIIRGPEENPFWHMRDWTVFTPMVTVPFSVYGRSYIEDWAEPARAFIDMTNLILDGVYTTTMNAFGAQVDAFHDPQQLNEGVHPNKTYLLQAGFSVRDALQSVDLGQLPPESVQVWQSLKQEMREGAKLSEIALGQVPPKGDITATEVAQVQQSGSAMIRSMARTVEARFLEPVLTLMFQTALQHMDFEDPRVAAEIGQDTARMLNQRRFEFQQRDIKFRVRGISSLVDRQSKLRNLLSMLQTIGSNELLLRAFLEKHDVSAVVDELMTLYGVDSLDFRISEREQQLRSIAQQLNQVQGGDDTSQPQGQARRVPDSTSPGGQTP